MLYGHILMANTVVYNSCAELSLDNPLFLECHFTREDSVSQRLFFSCTLSHTNHNMSQFNSWVAGAGVRFLPNETQQQPLFADCDQFGKTVNIYPKHFTAPLLTFKVEASMSP